MNDLQEFLKVIADSIRAKKGTTELINPQDFKTEVDKLEDVSNYCLMPVEGNVLNFYAQPTDIIIPDMITSIGQECFKNMQLGYISHNDVIYQVGMRAFYNTSISTFSWPSKVNSIPPGCFERANISHIDNTNHVTEIREYAFKDSYMSFSDLDLSNVTFIGTNAFFQTRFSNWLDGNAILPKNLEMLGSEVFTDAFGNNNPVRIPTTLITLYNNTFKNSIVYFGDFEHPIDLQISRVTSSNNGNIFRVPEELYEDWINYSNWQYVADYVETLTGEKPVILQYCGDNLL